MKLKNIDPDRLAIVVCYVVLILGMIGILWLMYSLYFQLIPYYG